MASKTRPTSLEGPRNQERTELSASGSQYETMDSTGPLPGVAASVYRCERYGWGTCLRTILEGIHDTACPLQSLQGQEETIVKHIYSFLASKWAHHVEDFPSSKAMTVDMTLMDARTPLATRASVLRLDSCTSLIDGSDKVDQDFDDDRAEYDV
ncbi:expressed unknown protein [Seminavis robusta]|uniref:Uncharacterized protein n=1 Tax=Seminavis robusta TaxID=568900 RepID=A0A9N8F240_9STRA|nr:expressed unknown protein [Seminavis robusta]|eukprot:Sro3583_g349330.1 n/a (154) ;mRNA; r:1058-1519